MQSHLRKIAPCEWALSDAVGDDASMGKNIIQIKFWKERCHIVDLASVLDVFQTKTKFNFKLFVEGIFSE